jgi:hypothetical protein
MVCLEKVGRSQKHDSHLWADALFLSGGGGSLDKTRAPRTGRGRIKNYGWRNLKDDRDRRSGSTFGRRLVLCPTSMESEEMVVAYA